MTEKIDLKRTGRGFSRGEFRDHYDVECSIQESSLAGPMCIWLGAEEVHADPVTGEPFAPRMHLTQEMVSQLLPLLQFFVEHGHLPPSDREQV